MELYKTAVFFIDASTYIYFGMDECVKTQYPYEYVELFQEAPKFLWQRFFVKDKISLVEVGLNVNHVKIGAMNFKLQVITNYLKLLETFETSKDEFKKYVHNDAMFIEYPNLVTQKGQERDVTEALKGAELGKKILTSQKFEISNFFESTEAVIAETTWTGTMAVDAGHLKKGQVLKAYICMVMEFKDGKIFRQRNYDCYEPF